jgi:hypothetical protein
LTNQLLEAEKLKRQAAEKNELETKRSLRIAEKAVSVQNLICLSFVSSRVYKCVHITTLLLILVGDVHVLLIYPPYYSPLRTCTHQQVESAENRRVSQEAASNSAMQQMKARLDQLMNENTELIHKLHSGKK